jgi:transcriptional regulator with XRE-family HTH domain
MTSDRQGVARKILKGSLIRAMRERRGLSQAQVAEALNAILNNPARPRRPSDRKKRWITQSASISQIELGRRGISTEVLEALAEVLRCKTDDFFGDPEEPEPQVPAEPQVPGVPAESQAVREESEPRLPKPLLHHLAYHRSTSDDHAASLYSFTPPRRTVFISAVLHVSGLAQGPPLRGVAPQV